MEEEQKLREQRFHDNLYSQASWEDGPRRSTLKYYSAVRNNRQEFLDMIGEHARGKCILEIGCGEGGYCFEYQKIAEHVSGIDISDVAVASANRKAAEAGFTNMSFETMDVEAMRFPAESFDVVYGAGILHHLNIDRSLREIARVLKPNGVVIFTEPLGHNPVINLYRRVTPNMRSPDEHPILWSDFRIFDRYFARTDATFNNLFSMLAVPFRALPIFPKLLRWLERVDESVFRAVPFLQRYAWTTNFVLSGPRPTTTRTLVQG